MIHVDKTFVINLDSRNDRWERMRRHLEEFELPNERVSATQLRFDSTIPRVKLGQISCFHSHLKILRRAYEANLASVLILEDDCQFIRQPEMEIGEFINSPKCEILYLGCNLKIFRNSNKTVFLAKKRSVGPFISEVSDCGTTHAIIYKRSLISKLMDLFPTDESFFQRAFGGNEESFIYDVFLSTFTTRVGVRKYAVDPILCTQVESFSDIAQATVDYAGPMASSWTEPPPPPLLVRALRRLRRMATRS